LQMAPALIDRPPPADRAHGSKPPIAPNEARAAGPFDREIVLDGEIAVPDDRGVTHISDLQDAIAGRRRERLAYFAFDLLHLDGH
jgi:ATP-dependent DNA ligase